MAFGNYDVRDTSLVLQFGGASPDQTVLQFGEQDAYQEVEKVLAIHNAIMAELRSELCQITSNYQGVYGGLSPKRMVKGNEHSLPLVQKSRGGLTIGFPIEKREIATGWSRLAFQQMTLERFRMDVDETLMADVRDFRQTMMQAIFNPLNDPDFEDELVDYKKIAVYAFINGDGNPVPSALDGSSFPTNHTHYTFLNNNTITEQALRDLVTNVIEHGPTGDVKIYISRSFESAIKAMQATGAFYPYPQENVRLGSDVSYALGNTIDLTNYYNRSIGTFDGVEVCVRSWVPSRYAVCVDTGGPNDKPLAFRVLPGGQDADLGLRFEDETYPLRAQTWDRKYGIAPWQRHKAAILYVNSGATAYVAPTTYPGV